MTAYEMIDGKYYEQGSDEYYQALEDNTATEYPTVDTARVLINHFWTARKSLERLIVLAGLRQ